MLKPTIGSMIHISEAYLEKFSFLEKCHSLSYLNTYVFFELSLWTCELCSKYQSNSFLINSTQAQSLG